MIDKMLSKEEALDMLLIKKTNGKQGMPSAGG